MRLRSTAAATSTSARTSMRAAFSASSTRVLARPSRAPIHPPPWCARKSANMLEDVGRDVRYGLRTLKRHPGFTITALLSLAVGIGASTGIFSLVDQVLLRLLRGVNEPERLVI